MLTRFRTLWDNAPPSLSDPPPLSPAVTLIARFLQEDTITDWHTFTFSDVQAAYIDLLFYTPIEHIDDYDDEDDGDVNRDNLWHPLLQVSTLIDTLAMEPGFCPPTIPFY